jgi:hypothetical protein
MAENIRPYGRISTPFPMDLGHVVAVVFLAFTMCLSALRALPSVLPNRLQV